MEKERKQESPLLPKDNQWQRTSKAAVWNEVCFLVTNPSEKLMLHVYHDPLGSIETIMEGRICQVHHWSYEI